MEICVHGVHEQATGAHQFPFGSLQPRDGTMLQGSEGTSEIT